MGNNIDDNVQAEVFPVGSGVSKERLNSLEETKQMVYVRRIKSGKTLVYRETATGQTHHFLELPVKYRVVRK